MQQDKRNHDVKGQVMNRSILGDDVYTNSKQGVREL